jgi:hypothetical protein
MVNIETLIEIRNGWHWPKSDTKCWSYMNKFPDLPLEISKYVQNKNTVAFLASRLHSNIWVGGFIPTQSKRKGIK